MKYIILSCVLLLNALLFTQDCLGQAGSSQTAFLWGTESQPMLVTGDSGLADDLNGFMDIINQHLKTKYVKVRLRLPMDMDADFQPRFCVQRGATYSAASSACSQGGVVAYDLDKAAKIFKENGWSMIPMFSHAGSPGNNPTIDDAHIDRYGDFVEWFVDRYKEDADIRYIELVNAPEFTWRGTAEQLLSLNNKTYERLKQKHPELKIGTPGFEYFFDSVESQRGINHQVFRDYFLEHDAKFDFWAFHGYPARGSGMRDFYPPNKTAQKDKYAGIFGIAELRKKMDQLGWNDRGIIDAEHTGILPAGSFDKEADRQNAVYMVQEMLLKRTLKVDGKNVLDGIIALKVVPRCELAGPMMGGGGPSSSSEGGMMGPGGPSSSSGGRMMGPGGPIGGRNKMRPIGPPRQRPQQQEQGSKWGGECAWGSLYSNGSVSLTAKAVGKLMTLLSEYEHVAHVSGRFDNENEVWMEKFASKNKELYICFKPFKYRSGSGLVFDSSPSAYSFELNYTPSTIEEADIQGNVKSLSVKSKLSLQVDNSPKYIFVTK